MQARYNCHSVYPIHVKTLPTPSVAHTCTQHAPHSLPSCAIAPRRHLPALLRPASAAKATVPSVAGSWACRHLPGSAAAPGTCRPRHFAPANADERASCRVPGSAKTCVACRPRQYSGKARLFRAPDVCLIWTAESQQSHDPNTPETDHSLDTETNSQLEWHKPASKARGLRTCSCCYGHPAQVKDRSLHSLLGRQPFMQIVSTFICLSI